MFICVLKNFKQITNGAIPIVLTTFCLQLKGRFTHVFSCLFGIKRVKVKIECSWKEKKRGDTHFSYFRNTRFWENYIIQTHTNMCVYT